MRTLFGIGILIAMLLSACSFGGGPGAGSTPVPTSGAASAPVVATAPVATANPLPPTPTFESVPPDLEVTVAPATPGGAPQLTNTSQLSGTLAWRDQILRSDSVRIQISGLAPPPAGQVYAAWLGSQASSLPIGTLNVSSGLATLTYVSPARENLLATYERVYVTQAPQAQATTAMTNVIYYGALPPQALIHIRHVLVSFPDTPGQIGFALGLRQESDELLRHAQFLRDAHDASDLALAKVHAEHIINIIRGSEQRDVNGDGKVQNPGDGYGLLPNGQQLGYIKGMVDHAKLAADAPDATADIKLHAGHVQISGENVRGRVEEIRGLAEQVAAAASLEQTTQSVLTILSLSEQAIQGVDANLDEQVGPVPGEGGVITAYQHGQLMAAVVLTPGAVAQAPAPAPAGVAAPAGGQTFTVDIGDNTFTANKLTIPVGSKIIWTHKGQRPHNVTADDSSFKSEEQMRNGATFEQTFTSAGTFPYFCSIHGGAGGQGMAGSIVVTEGSAAAPAVAPIVPGPAAPVAPAAPAAPAQPAPAAGASEVVIGDNSFTPAQINVPIGGTVTWRHQGQRKHTVTAENGSFNSGTLSGGMTFQQTFKQAGEFRYICKFHPEMVGTIRVGGGAAQSGGAQSGHNHSAGAPPAAPAPPATPAPAAAPQPGAAAAPTAPLPVAQPAPAAVTVSMKDFEFAPREIRVKVGATITWTNDGARRHSAKAVDGSFDTGLFDPGGAKSVTFNAPGTFAYFCELHGTPDGKQDMVGTVVVEP